LPNLDALETLSHWIGRELQGLDEATDVWDGYLQIVLKGYVSRYEPPADMWAEIKAKVQREAVLNQVHSYVP
jgi:hypothetical protein